MSAFTRFHVLLALSLMSFSITAAADGPAPAASRSDTRSTVVEFENGGIRTRGRVVEAQGGVQVDQTGALGQSYKLHLEKPIVLGSENRYGDYYDNESTVNRGGFLINPELQGQADMKGREIRKLDLRAGGMAAFRTSRETYQHTPKDGFQSVAYNREHFVRTSDVPDGYIAELSDRCGAKAYLLKDGETIFFDSRCGAHAVPRYSDPQEKGGVIVGRDGKPLTSARPAQSIPTVTREEAYTTAGKPHLTLDMVAVHAGGRYLDDRRTGTQVRGAELTPFSITTHRAYKVKSTGTGADFCMALAPASVILGESKMTSASGNSHTQVASAEVAKASACAGLELGERAGHVLIDASHVTRFQGNGERETRLGASMVWDRIGSVKNPVSLYVEGEYVISPNDAVNGTATVTGGLRVAGSGN